MVAGSGHGKGEGARLGRGRAQASRGREERATPRHEQESRWGQWAWDWAGGQGHSGEQAGTETCKGKWGSSREGHHPPGKVKGRWEGKLDSGRQVLGEGTQDPLPHNAGVGKVQGQERVRGESAWGMGTKRNNEPINWEW